MLLLFLCLLLVSGSDVISDTSYITCKKNSNECNYVYQKIIRIDPVTEDLFKLDNDSVAFHTSTYEYLAKPAKHLYMPAVTPVYHVCADCDATFLHESTNCKCSYPDSSKPSAKNFIPSSLHKCSFGKDGFCLAVSLDISNISCYYYKQMYPEINVALDFNYNYDSECSVSYLDGSYSSCNYGNYEFSLTNIQVWNKEINKYHCWTNNKWYEIDYSENRVINTDPLSVIAQTSVTRLNGVWQTRYIGYNYALDVDVSDDHIIYTTNPYNIDEVRFYIYYCTDNGVIEHIHTRSSFLSDRNVTAANYQFKDQIDGTCHFLPLIVYGIDGRAYTLSQPNNLVQLSDTNYLYDVLPKMNFDLMIKSNISFNIATYVNEKCPVYSKLSCVFVDKKIIARSDCEDGFVYIDYQHVCQIRNGVCELERVNGLVKLLGTDLTCSNTYDTDAVTGWVNGLFTNNNVVRNFKGYWFSVLLAIIVIIICIIILCNCHCSCKRGYKFKDVKFD